VTYFYRAYGITLASDTALPGLRQEPAHTNLFDLELAVGPEPDWVREVAHPTSPLEHLRHRRSEEHDSVNLTSLGEGYYQLEYIDGTQFVLDGAAKRLWGTFQAPLTLEDFATYLSGPVLGFILRRREVTALHASALSIDGNAVILCGESESGKSTTLAAMALRKFPILTEDISPITQESGALYVQPGYPRICLWPDAVQMLFGEPEALPLLTPTWEKRFLPLDGVRGSFEPQRQRLGVVYLLSPRTDNAKAPYIEELTMRDALLLLVQNTYMNWTLNRSQRAAELDFLTKVVEHVPVRRIFPHMDPAHISDLCELIADDARAFFRIEVPVPKSSHG
jgi:hypothetical protein